MARLLGSPGDGYKMLLFTSLFSFTKMRGWLVMMAGPEGTEGRYVFVGNTSPTAQEFQREFPLSLTVLSAPAADSL